MSHATENLVTDRVQVVRYSSTFDSLIRGLDYALFDAFRDFSGRVFQPNARAGNKGRAKVAFKRLLTFQLPAFDSVARANLQAASKPNKLYPTDR